MKRILLAFLLALFTFVLFSQNEAISRSDSLRKDALNVYMDASDYLKKEIPFINYVRDIKDADLIIISTHGHTGVEHLLFGSTSEKVVRKAPCPVLSMREPIKGFRFSG